MAKRDDTIVKSLDGSAFELPPTATPTPVTRPVRPKPPWLKITLLVAAVLVALAVGLGVFAYFLLYLPGQTILSSVHKLEDAGRQVEASLKAKDLAGAKTQLLSVETNLAQVKADFARLAWLQSVPFGSLYYSDSQHAFAAASDLIDSAKISLDGIEPYADLLGLKTATSSASGKPEVAKDRIQLIVTTLDALKPKLSDVGAKLAHAQGEVKNIDPSRYPEDFRGTKVRAILTSAINSLDIAADLVTQARPLLEVMPVLVGKDAPIKYLLIFENDAELRPTGGFMTGYAIVTVSKGKLSVEQSGDIYNLDEKFPKRITAPDPILKYHPKVPYWYLRDQNLSPDFKVSMDTFYPNYKLTKSPEVKGIIAVDTQVLVDLLKVTGQIGIGGYGNFSADNDPRCNCPNVFYQLQILAGAEEPVVWDSVSGKIVKAPANYGNRKGFLGPVMYSIMANVLGQPKSKFADLFQTAFKLIEGKHVLFYFEDPQIQSAVESFNLAGRLRPSDHDYLLVVDTNFSGGKTNIWVKYEAKQEIEISSTGAITKTLTLTYSNPEDSSVKIESGRRLNGLFRDWLRVYVPKGSKLVGDTKEALSGFETGEAVGEDLGFTTFEGFFTLAPGNTKVIKIKYTVPVTTTSPYKLTLQKQPGTKDFIYKTKINSKTLPETVLSKDLELSFPY